MAEGNSVAQIEGVEAPKTQVEKVKDAKVEKALVEGLKKIEVKQDNDKAKAENKEANPTEKVEGEEKPAISELRAKLRKMQDEIAAAKLNPSPAEPIKCFIDHKIMDLGKIFNQYEEKCIAEGSRVEYWILRGKLFHNSSTFVYKTIDAFTRAAKLDPSLFHIWNELGDCYWEVNEHGLAQKCFECALEKERNPVSLRNLSIIARKTNSNHANVRFSCAEKGVNLAKEAVKLDPTDSISWAVLGNSYMSAYFNIKADPMYAQLAIRAYKQAEKSSSSVLDSDLYFNKFVALKFIEDFQGALEALHKAAELSNGNGAIDEAQEQMEKYLNTVQTLSSTHGKLNLRRINALQREMLRDPGKFLGELGKKNIFKLVAIKDMKHGVNEGVVIFGKVTWNHIIGETFPFTFGFMDSNGEAGIVTVYNLIKGKGYIIGDSIAIPNPNVCTVAASYKKKEYSFLKIRVGSPTDIILNGKPTPATYCGHSAFKTNQN